MTGEIYKDFYCSGNKTVCNISGGFVSCLIGFGDIGCDKANCGNYHRKHPTPEQFKEEFKEEYPDDGAVYFWDTRYGNGLWAVGEYGEIIDEDHWKYEEHKPGAMVCACTPWGKPPDDWRPE
jgi:hypothetical protein